MMNMPSWGIAAGLLAFGLMGCGPSCEEIRHHEDLDGDGYGNPDAWEEACEAPYATVTDGTDCDDNDSKSHPDMLDACDGRDNDCDGTIDEDRSDVTLYLDADGDGYGSVVSWTGCGAPPTPLYRASEPTDCDDLDPDVFPGAREWCNDVDDNCDGSIDEDALDVVQRWTDLDEDGFGDALIGQPVWACPDASGSSDTRLDCDDDRADVNPTAVEVCNGVDNNCNGVIDENPVDGADFWVDIDDDGFGGTGTVRACQPGLVSASDTYYEYDGYYSSYDEAYFPYSYEFVWAVEQGGDCNDFDSSVNPSEPEVCNGRDDNCNGSLDDNDPTLATSFTPTWYLDVDGDNYGRTTTRLWACSQPPSYAPNPDDCDDDDDEVFPGATEVCNGIDDDCDDRVDDDDPQLPTCPS